MTSNHLFFKLMKEDLKNRIWAIALISLGCFFTYPVTAAFTAGTIRDYSTPARGLAVYSREMMQWLSFSNGMTVFVMILTALVCGFSGFSYLNSRSKVDFYHSIPIRREKLFLVNYVNGILITAVPFAISMVAAAVVCISNGVDSVKLWPAVLTAVALHLVYYMLGYSLVVIAAMMTGNLVVGVLGSIVLAFYVPLAGSLTQGFFGVFFKTYDWSSGEKAAELANRISPVMEYIYQVGRYNDGEFRTGSAVIALCLTILLAAVALFLYRKRPSETAGRAMAFKVSRPVIRILITIVSGMGLGVFFWSMRESMGWAVFGIICGTVISHCVIEIIYHFDFKKLFANRGQLVICTVICIGMMCVFRYDLFGYDTYLPDSGKVENAAVRVAALSDWVSIGEVREGENGTYLISTDHDQEMYESMQYSDTENLLALARVGVDQVLLERRGAISAESEQYEYSPYETGTLDVYICYHLKGGRDVCRRYAIPVERVVSQLNRLYEDAEYQKGTFPLMNRTAEAVTTVRYRQNQKENTKSDLTVEQVQALLEAYQEEFKSLDIETMKDEYPTGLIRFNTQVDERAISFEEKLNTEEYAYDSYQGYRRNAYYYRFDFTDRDYYPVYPSFTKTTELLETYGLLEGVPERRWPVIQSVSITRFPTELQDADSGSRTGEMISITDRSAIEELASLLVDGNMRYYNRFFETEDLEIEVSVLDTDETYVQDAYLKKGTVPQLVEEEFRYKYEKGN